MSPISNAYSCHCERDASCHLTCLMTGDTNTPLVLLLVNVLQQLWMHGGQRHKQRLNGRIIGDAATALRVTAHPVHKDLDAAAKCCQKLFAVFRRADTTGRLTILISLHR